MQILKILGYVVQGIAVLGGLGGITSLLLTRTQKRRLLSESSKTDAEADSILADAQTKRSDRELRLVSAYERWGDSLQERLEEAEEKIALLTEYIEVLVQALRTAGAPVPPVPRKMVEEAHARMDPDTSPKRIIRPSGRNS